MSEFTTLAVSSQLAATMRSRRTIGAFESRAVPEDVLAEALELSTWAPNHRKTEPWRFYRLGPVTAAALVDLNARLVAEKKGPEAAATKQRQWAQVPGWLVVTCLRSAESLQQEEDYAACCCAIQNWSLALWSAGVGSKWSTGDVTRHAEFARLVGFDPAAERVVGLLWYGYPAVVPQQTRSPAREFLRNCP